MVLVELKLVIGIKLGLVVLDFCYINKSKLFKIQNGFTHGLWP